MWAGWSRCDGSWRSATRPRWPAPTSLPRFFRAASRPTATKPTACCHCAPSMRRAAGRSRPTELMPGVWFTGPVPRPYQERNWPKGLLLQGPDGPAEDSIPEDASVVVDTKDGLIIITGCGHAGVVNTAEYARSFLRPAPVHAVIGGLHLFAATDAQVAWTAGKLRELGVAYLLGAHCTGIEATYRLREIIGLTRKTAVVGAVGASFTLGKGLDPLGLAG